MKTDTKTFDALVCPECKGDISLNPEKEGLICEKCGLEYPIRNDIPIMLSEQAKRI